MYTVKKKVFNYIEKNTIFLKEHTSAVAIIALLQAPVGAGHATGKPLFFILPNVYLQQLFTVYFTLSAVLSSPKAPKRSCQSARVTSVKYDKDKSVDIPLTLNELHQGFINYHLVYRSGLCCRC